MKTEAMDSSSLFVLFRIQGTLFSISDKWVSDIELLPNAATQLPDTPPYISGICNSCGRLVTLINLPYLLGLAYSNSRQIIILSPKPAKALLIEDVLGVEKSYDFSKTDRPIITSSLIQNFYCYNKTQEIVMEINVPYLLDNCLNTFPCKL